MRVFDVGLFIVAVIAVLTVTVAVHRSENGSWKLEATSLIPRWVFEKPSVSDDNPKNDAPNQKNDLAD